MAWGDFLIFLGSAVVGFPAIEFKDAAEVSSRSVVLADLSDLMGVPPKIRAAVAKLEVARAPSRHKAFSIQKSALAAKVRALVPGFAPWLPVDLKGDIVINGANSLRNAIFASAGDNSSVEIGDLVTAQARVGAYLITRQGIAMQAARPGERFFMKTTDGVLSVRCCGEQ